MDKKNWMVQMPIDDIIALYRAMEEHDKTKAENAHLRREIDGLRKIQNDCIVLLGDLRRELNGVSR